MTGTNMPRFFLWGLIVVVALGGALFGYFVYSPTPEAPRLSGKLIKGTIEVGGLKRTYLTYVPQGGFGQMVKAGEAWTFEMQMSTDRGDNRLLHWANMVETREGEASWDRLPGLDLSVPQMLEGAVYPQLETE